MASNTRRMSGMAAQPGGQALLDTLDAFRRKHASQNREIIHKNSDLMRANTDLSNKLRESQNELVALRGDYAELLSAAQQLDAKNAGLRDQLRQAHAELRRRDAAASNEIRMQEERFQALSITVNKVVAQMQGVQAICLLTASDNKNAASFYSPASPPASPPFASVPATFGSSRPASSISTSTSHKLERRASVQALVSTQPDLSYISEGSQEPSLSLSQQEYKPYSSSDDEGDAEGCQYHHETDEDTLRADQYAKHDNNHRRQPFLLQDLRQDILAVSSASSVEPDYVGQEIEQNLLSASPKRPPPAHPFSLGTSFPEDLASSTSTSASPTPTMPSFPVMPGAFLQPEVEPNSTASQRSQISAGASTSSIASDTKGKKARPSLLAQIGISPGHLDISFGQGRNDPVLSANSTERRRSQRSREVSPSPYTAQQSSSSDDEDSDSPQVVSSSSQKRKIVSSDDPDGLYLSKTVRHSTSATTLREKAKTAAASSALNGILAVDASPANRVIARRRSNPTLKTTSDLSDSGKVPSLIFGNSKNDKKRSSTSSLDARPKPASKIVQAMQSRPSSVQLTALDGKASTSTKANPTSKPAGVTISRPRSNSAVHKKLPSVSPTNTKNIVSLVGNDSPAASKASLLGENSPAVNPNVTGRSRARPIRSRSSSPEVEMNTCDTTSVLADMTGSTLPQLSASKKSASPSKSTAKGKAKESSPSTSKRVIREREQTPSADVSSQESAAQQDLSIDSVSAANASGREGRRARANVSYQEPSLNKKMRQPAGYVASIKTSSSKHSGPGLGVRRKSSLSLGGQGRNSASPAPPSEHEMGDSMAEQHEDFDGNDDIDVGGEKLV